MDLPDGRHWLRGKLGLVLMGEAMLSKPLIQFSVDGWGSVLSLLFTWGQTDVDNEDNGDLLQKVPYKQSIYTVHILYTVYIFQSSHDFMTLLNIWWS